MSTVRDICTRALRRARVVDALETPAANDMAAALSALNELFETWQSSCNMLLQAQWALADTFTFFVPPLDAGADVIDVLSYRGTWDADANNPALATGTGTKGYAYKVSTAGSTTLDDVTSWAAADYAVYSGTAWLKSIDSTRLHGAVVALLVERLADDFGYQLTPQMSTDAALSRYRMHSYYVKPPVAGFDQALRSMPSRTVTVAFEEL